jgi:hypothetical protein
MKSTQAIVLAAILAVSCGKVSEKAGETIDSGAQKVGKTATDIVNSIDKGISESAGLTITLSDRLRSDGLSFGKYYIRENSEGKDNTLSLYLISDKEFDGTLHVRLYDKKHVEMGRLDKRFQQKAGAASYCDFVFDDNIEIENQSKVTIE